MQYAIKTHYRSSMYALYMYMVFALCVRVCVRVCPDGLKFLPRFTKFTIQVADYLHRWAFWGLSIHLIWLKNKICVNVYHFILFLD